MPAQPAEPLQSDMPPVMQDHPAGSESLPRFVVQEVLCMVVPAEQLRGGLNPVGQLQVGGRDFVIVAADTLRHQPLCRHRLTRREREIAWLVAEGLFTKQIAHRLGVSPHTVNAYMNRIFTRLSVHTRAEMVAVMLKEIR
ncbi:helix-turn-helix transcriptional regulator [Geminicoccus roseus]|uniref:helix-turn-helix transcriptional regulator n=1 Tax=Geminicoccus roseus TaxID=404900 RepID=UPI00040D04C2|nr:helix-turn-helix transcriptional regulator [Geminicoccus roseus]